MIVSTYPNASLALKITNWCNLNCAHCAESSSCRQPLNLMPLQKLDQHIAEFKKLPLRQSECLSITGGEGMAPYFRGENMYMLRALKMVHKHGFIPTIKTNGSWGNDSTLRNQILMDLGMVAYANQKFVTMDISVDEFHDNIDPTVNIIRSVAMNPHLANALRIVIVGLYTEKSIKQYDKLIQALHLSGLKMTPNNNFSRTEPDIDILLPGHNWTLYGDYKAPLMRRGRAADNNLTNAFPGPGGSDCIMVDNNDNVTVNYNWIQNLKGSTFADVVSNLIQQSRER